MSTSISHALNVVKVEGVTLPFAISELDVLRLATPVESKHLHEMMEGQSGGHPYVATWIYENDIVEVGDAPGQFRAGNLLPPAQWRYHVIERNPNGGLVERVQDAATIAGVPLELGLDITVHSENGRGWGRPRAKLFHGVQLPTATDCVTLTRDDLAKIRTFTDLLWAHDHEALNLRWLLDERESLKDLPPWSRLQLLGYFALVEALITHQPEPKDPYDSLRRQIQMKVELLRNRFEEALDVAAYFGSAKSKTIWTELYSYRSAIAHGADREVPGILKNDHNVHRFMQELVRRLFMVALREPALVRDLQNC